MMLPEVIRIDQRPSLVRISDSQNRMLQEILIDRRFDSRNGGQAGFDPRDRGRSDRHDYLSGRWSGSTLMVESTGLRGGSITQTFALQDRGRSLVVRTRRDGSNSGRTVEFTKVYRRA